MNTNSQFFMQQNWYCYTTFYSVFKIENDEITFLKSFSYKKKAENYLIKLYTQKNK